MGADSMSIDPMYVTGIDTGLSRAGVGIIELVGNVCRARTFVIATADLKVDNPVEQYKRINTVVSGVSAVIPNYAAELSLIEAPAYKAEFGKPNERAAVYYGVIGVLYRRGSPIGTVAPKTLKRWAVGRAGSTDHPVEKKDIVAAMHTIWPDVPATFSELRHHECEALAMAMMCAQRLGWPVPVERHHAHPLTVVKWPDMKHL